MFIEPEEDAEHPADFGRPACRFVGGAAAGRPHRRSRRRERNTELLAAAERALDGCVPTPAAVDAHCEAVGGASHSAGRDEETASIRTAIATLNGAVLAAYGRLTEPWPVAQRWRLPRPRG